MKSDVTSCPRSRDRSRRDGAVHGSWLVGRATNALSLATFPLPVPTPPLIMSLAWHPRFDADPAHRWLRGHVRAPWAERSLEPRRVAG